MLQAVQASIEPGLTMAVAQGGGQLAAGGRGWLEVKGGVGVARGHGGAASGDVCAPGRAWGGVVAFIAAAASPERGGEGEESQQQYSGLAGQDRRALR